MQPLRALGATTHTHISKIQDKSLPLYGGAPSSMCYTCGCSHRQYLFCFWIMLSSPPLCFLLFSTSWKALLNSGTAKRAQRIFFLSLLIILVMFHHSPKPSRAPFGNLFIPNPSRALDHLQRLHLSLSSIQTLQRSWGHLTSCSPSALGSKLSDETIQHHLLKPRSLCAAAGTDIFIKAFELSCSTPSL